MNNPILILAPLVIVLTACNPFESAFDRDLRRCEEEATKWVDMTIEGISRGDMSFRKGPTMTDVPTCYVLMNDETLTRDEKRKIITWMRDYFPKLMDERINKFERERRRP